MTIQLHFGSAPLSRAEADRLVGTYLDDRHYDQVIGRDDGEDVAVYREDGEPLLVYRPGALDPAVYEPALPALRRAARWSNNRQAPSGTLGYYDRTPRDPYCRVTERTRDDADGWRDVQPLLKAMDGVFREALPDRYAAQAAFARATSPDFRIGETTFSTVTVNGTHRFKAHKDKGNLKVGFGVLAVVRSEGYSGGVLVFPRYQVAVDLRAGDVLLFCGTEVHGSGPIVPTARAHERVSVVGYYRARMIHCGTAAEETERAKRHRPGDPLYP